MSSTVNPAIVLELIESFRQSKTMFAGCELGVFDKLALSPATVAQLAFEIGADVGNLEKLLDALVGLADQGVRELVAAQKKALGL